jgi:hypothetical protein
MAGWEGTTTAGSQPQIEAEGLISVVGPQWIFQARNDQLFALQRCPYWRRLVTGLEAVRLGRSLSLMMSTNGTGLRRNSDCRATEGYR